MINFRLLVAASTLAFGLSACAGLFGERGALSSVIHVGEDTRRVPNAKQEKYPITVKVGVYADERNVDSPRRLGIVTGRVMGVTSKDLILDRDVATVVGDSIKKYLGASGFQLVDGESTKPQFQLSGVVKELSIDVKDRDYANLAIESTLTEVATGKVMWSGVVVEKADRFAGTSGNSRKDVVNFLRAKLGVVSSKTSESILSLLMSTRPELFNMVVGVSPVQGVTVYSNMATSAVAATLATPAKQPAAANGTLAVSSSPARTKVYVDGVYFGMTPLRAELAAGVYEISLKQEGYQTASEKVSVRKAETTELELKLHR